MLSRLRHLGLVLALVMTLVLGMVLGMAVDRPVACALPLPGSPTAATAPDFQLLREAWNTIQQHYVDRSAVVTDTLMYGAVGGMVNALGDTGHSRFMTPEMVKQQQNFTQGQFEGIGAQVDMRDGRLVIVAPMDNSPAQQADLRPGDEILKVDGKDISGLPMEQALSLILGEAGTRVTLTIHTPSSNQTRDVTLLRARIKLNNVAWQQLPGTTIAHVRVAAFSNGVTQELVKALQQVQAQKSTGIILDLRNDPGGLLDESVGVASQFLSGGNVLLEKDAQGKTVPEPVRPGGLALYTPMVVLINSGTASASEIVAGALQDAGRASLIGETTFGTGTVLNQFGLSDGSAILLATQEWLTPKGRVIWHQGIVPDISVSMPAQTLPLTPEAERQMTPEELKATQDLQLLRAIGALALQPAPATQQAAGTWLQVR